jgi:hypothetical protein
MKITDIIRGILDLADVAIERQAEPQAQIVAIEPEQACDSCGSVPCACEPEQEPDLINIIKQLSGLSVEDEDMYANEPKEVVASIGASYPGGDDMHNCKNPADIRSNATSMYPGFQAEKR